MSKPNFDERFPSMFQPGGDTPEPPEASPMTGRVETAGNHKDTHPTRNPPADQGAAAPGPQPAPQASSMPQPAGPPQPWRPSLWIAALAASAVLLAAGVFALTCQYWLPAARTSDPSDYQGIELQPWGQSIFAVAPALITAGIGVPLVLLFLASRHVPAKEPVRRTIFMLLMAVIGVVAWVALFAEQFFPAATMSWASAPGRFPVMPWTYLVAGTGTWLLSLALFMLAALLIVPRRWPQHVGEDAVDAGPDARVGPALRGLIYGVLLIAAGLYAVFAPYLFPLATGTVIVDLGEGRQTTRQDWAATVFRLVGPLFLVGTLVTGWALVHLAITPRREPAAELDGSGVEP